MPSRRTLLLTSAAGTAALVLLHPLVLEAKVIDALYYDALDEDRFAELQPGPGRKEIRARIVAPPGDPRIPASQQSPVLLIVFRLDEPPPPGSTPDPLPRWHIGCDVRAVDGSIRRETVPLLARPHEIRTNRAIRDPNLAPLPGMIYRGAIATELTPLLQALRLPSGTTLHIGYGQQAATRVTLP